MCARGRAPCRECGLPYWWVWWRRRPQNSQVGWYSLVGGGGGGGGTGFRVWSPGRGGSGGGSSGSGEGEQQQQQRHVKPCLPRLPSFLPHSPVPASPASHYVLWRIFKHTFPPEWSGAVVGGGGGKVRSGEEEEAGRIGRRTQVRMGQVLSLPDLYKQ